MLVELRLVEQRRRRSQRCWYVSAWRTLSPLGPGADRNRRRFRQKHDQADRSGRAQARSGRSPVRPPRAPVRGNPRLPRPDSTTARTRSMPEKALRLKE